MFENIKNFFAVTAAPKGGKATPVAPKVKAGQTSRAGYVKTMKPSKAALTKNDLQIANQDLSATYRTGNTTLKVIQDLTRVSPDLSAALSAFLRVGIPENYLALARNPDGSVSPEATTLVAQIIRTFDLMPDYTVGFAQTSTFRSLSESLGKELIQGGACSIEVVLNKAQLPDRFQAVPVGSLEFYEDGNGLMPAQVVSGTRIMLDQPTFIYTSLDQSLLTAYPASPMESAVQPVLASMTFLNDLRRVCNRYIYPRYDIEIDEEALRKSIPPDISADSQKLSAFFNETIDGVETMINELGVEDALCHFDFIKVKYIEGGAVDVPSTFSAVKDIYNGKVSTGAKVMPSILGHSTGSQNIASTETMLFILTANGMIRLKLQEVFSKALTLCARLYGMDVTVSFEFESIDLRPTSELEAFKAMKQSRFLELLSLGLISDEEACLRLTGQLPPAGYVKKSGTMFKTATGISSNPNSGTNGEALNQSLTPDTPKNKKS